MTETRARALERLTAETLDLLVVGAGITGSRVAYEAARIGMRVALVDAGDIASGTSSASSKLLHGGLRYLARGDLRLVAELQAERRVLTSAVAPHLARPLSLVVAGGRRASIPKLAAGIALYAALGHRSRPRPRMVLPRTAAALLPEVDQRALGAVAIVPEAQTHDARLTLATARGAERLGAIVLNHVAVAGFERTGAAIRGAELVDALGGGTLHVSCRGVVAATGAAIDRVRRLEDPRAAASVRLSKGVHLLLRTDDEWGAGLALFDEARSALALPWQGMLMLGATDTALDDVEGQVSPSAGDVSTVLDWFRGTLSTEQLRDDRIVGSFAGVRVLPLGRSDSAAARRRPLVSVGSAGMVAIAGGKLTAHRPIAVEALRALPPELRPRRLRASADPLPGARGIGAAAARLRAILEPELARHLLHLYGGEALQVLDAAADPRGRTRIHPAGPDVWAQVAFARSHEWGTCVDDVVARRTTLAVRGLASQGVRDEVAEELGAPAQVPARRQESIV